MFLKPLSSFDRIIWLQSRTPIGEQRTRSDFVRVTFVRGRLRGTWTNQASHGGKHTSQSVGGLRVFPRLHRDASRQKRKPAVTTAGRPPAGANGLTRLRPGTSLVQAVQMDSGPPVPANVSGDRTRARTSADVATVTYERARGWRCGWSSRPGADRSANRADNDLLRLRAQRPAAATGNALASTSDRCASCVKNSSQRRRSKQSRYVWLQCRLQRWRIHTQCNNYFMSTPCHLSDDDAQKRQANGMSELCEAHKPASNCNGEERGINALRATRNFTWFHRCTATESFSNHAQDAVMTYLIYVRGVTRIFFLLRSYSKCGMISIFSSPKIKQLCKR